MEFVPGSRWEPFRFEVAGFSRTQPVRRAIQFGFEVIRSGIRIFSQGSCSIIVQSQLRTVGPKNDGRLSRIFFAFLVLKAFDHGVLAAAVDDSEPAVGRVEPEFGGHVHVVHGEQPVFSYRNRGIFCRTEANVIAVQITARWICRSKCPEIVIEARGSGWVRRLVLRDRLHGPFDNVPGYILQGGVKAYERRVAAKADGALKLDSCLRIRRAGKFDLALLGRDWVPSCAKPSFSESKPRRNTNAKCRT